MNCICRQTAIKINDELLAALKGQRVLISLIKDITPAAAYKLCEKNLETKFSEIEAKIKLAENRKIKFLKEDGNVR